MNEKWALLNRGPSLHMSMSSPTFTGRERRCLLIALLFVSTCLMMTLFHQRRPHSSSLSATAIATAPSKETLAHFRACSIAAFLSTGLPFLHTASPLPTSEFTKRRHNLALALLADDIDAFILEPGYTFQYYANVSQPDWEVWEPEEMPFLMAVRPAVVEAKGNEEGEVARKVKVKTTFLAPSFEVQRA